MNYRAEAIESRLRSGEDSSWEFKQVEFAGNRPKRPTRGDWPDEIAAFADAVGGVVLAGVSVHESSGGNYIRVGASKRLMGSDERLRLAQRRSQAHFLWLDKQPVPATGFKTLAEGAAEPEAALEKLALLDDDEAGVFRATVAGVLLCTPNPEQWLPNACITATRYRGRRPCIGPDRCLGNHWPAERTDRWRRCVRR